MSSDEELALAVKTAREAEDKAKAEAREVAKTATRKATEAAKAEAEEIERAEAAVRQRRYEAMQVQHDADVKKRESDLVYREARAKVLLETQALIADRECRAVQIAEAERKLKIDIATAKAKEREAKKAAEKKAEAAAESAAKVSYTKDPEERKRREAKLAEDEAKIKEFQSYHQIEKRFATRDEREAERMRIARAYIERHVKEKAVEASAVETEMARRRQEEIARETQAAKAEAKKRDDRLAAIENSPWFMRKALTGGVDPCPLCKAEAMLILNVAAPGLGSFQCGACDAVFDTLRVQNKWWMYREKEEKRVGWGRKHRFED